MKFVFDPFQEIIQIVKKKYPKLKAHIEFTDTFPEDEAADDEVPGGCTIFPDDGSTPLILIGVNLPVNIAVEVLAHELAHVIVGYNADHGKKWESKFNWIHREYVKTVLRKNAE